MWLVSELILICPSNPICEQLTDVTNFSCTTILCVTQVWFEYHTNRKSSRPGWRHTWDTIHKEDKFYIFIALFIRMTPDVFLFFFCVCVCVFFPGGCHWLKCIARTNGRLEAYCLSCVVRTPDWLSALSSPESNYTLQKWFMWKEPQLKTLALQHFPKCIQ